VALDGRGDMVAMWTRTGASRGTWTRRYTGANVERPITQKSYSAGSILLGQDVVGHAYLTVFSNGTYTFSVDFHDSSFWSSYDVDLTFSIVSASNVLYTFSYQGHVSGWISPGPSDVSWSTSGSNPALAAGWADIVDGTSFWHADTKWDLAALLTAIKNDAQTVAAIYAIVA
jgi:hypothetical protein